MTTHAHGPEWFRELKARGPRAIAILLVGLLGGCAPTAWVGGSLDGFDRAFDESLVVWTPDLPPAVVGKEYRFALNARGLPKPFRWKLLSGQLPEGIELDGEGVLQGTATGAGASSFVVKVACTPVVSRQAPGESPHVDWRMHRYSLVVKDSPVSGSGVVPKPGKTAGRKP